MTIPPTPQEPAAPASPRNPSSWWTRNRLALLAIAVLLPATAITIGWHHWHLMYDFGARPVQPLLVSEDDSAELAGATFGPVRSAVVEDVSGLDVPEDAQVIAVAIPVDAGAGAVSCRRPTLTDQKSGRQWNLMRSEIGVGYNSEEPETCTGDEGGRYELIAPFVVPDDVEGPFWVDVWPYESGGTFLRFSIEP